MLDQQIQHNKRQTIVIMLLFLVLIMTLGAFIGVATQYAKIDHWWQTAEIFGAIGVIYSLIMYFYASHFLMRISRAQQVGETDAPMLYHIVADMSMVAQIPIPKVYIVTDDSPNAFATGRNPKHGAVAATTGLLAIMNREELEGVMAHEISHIKNRDTQVSTLAATLTGLITATGMMIIGLGRRLIHNAFWFTSFGGGNNRNRSFLQRWAAAAIAGLTTIALGLIIMAIFVPIAKVMQFAISRQREALADVSGVNLTRNPEGLISAFEKLLGENSSRGGSSGMASRNQAANTLYINDSGKPRFKRNLKLNRLFSTHPPLQDRIARLRRLEAREYRN